MEVFSHSFTFHWIQIQSILLAWRNELPIQQPLSFVNWHLQSPKFVWGFLFGGWWTTNYPCFWIVYISYHPFFTEQKGTKKQPSPFYIILHRLFQNSHPFHLLNSTKSPVFYILKRSPGFGGHFDRNGHNLPIFAYQANNQGVSMHRMSYDN